MPASLECRNCLEPLWLCGDPVCCNHCDHTTKEPRFGEVWRFSDDSRVTYWMVVAPSTEAVWPRRVLLYLGSDDQPVSASYWAYRIRSGRSPFDEMSMDGLGRNWREHWERVE